MTRAAAQLGLFDRQPPPAAPGASPSAQECVHEETVIRDARERGDATYRCSRGCSHPVPPAVPEPDDGVMRNRYGFPLTGVVLENAGHPDWKPRPPEAPPAPGDRVRFTPFVDRRRLVQIEGLVVEEITSSGDDTGYHILAPLPDDPRRVVRVWLSDGMVAVLERATGAPAGVK